MNHWRSVSTSEIEEIGAAQACVANWGKTLKSSSPFLSRMFNASRAAHLSFSLLGSGAAGIDGPLERD